MQGCQLPHVQAKLNQRSSEIKTTDDHISFYSKDMSKVKEYLTNNMIPHLDSKLPIIEVSQIFLHDPDDHMVEFCACEDVTDEAYKPPQEYRNQHKENESISQMQSTAKDSYLLKRLNSV